MNRFEPDNLTEKVENLRSLLAQETTKIKNISEYDKAVQKAIADIEASWTDKILANTCSINVQEEMKKTLEYIKEFGFKNSGYGYTCATIANDCLKRCFNDD